MASGFNNVKKVAAMPDTPDCNTLEAAQKYVERGYKVVPIPYRRKAPEIKAWQKLRLTLEELPSRFGSHPQNIGILLGEASGGLVDVDCDCPEAIRAAACLLPPTNMQSGRNSAPRSHYWYLLEGEGVSKTLQFHDVGENGIGNGAMLIELRFNGTQTVVAPSIHPEGEPYVWYCEVPETVDAPTLVRAVKRVAATALLALHWRDAGAKHNTGLAVAGFLLRGGMSVEDASDFVALASRLAGHEDVADRVAAVKDSAERIQRGAPCLGYTALKECLHEKVVSRLNAWLDLKKPDEASAKDGRRTGRQDKGAKDEEETLSVAKLLIQLGEETELFHNERKEGCARLDVSGHKEIMLLSSGSFKQWLAKRLYDEMGKVASSQALEDAIRVLQAKALYQGECHPLSVRVASDSEGAVWYDLGDSAWQAVRMTPSGWEVVAETPILFRRYAITAPQVAPVEGGDIEALRRFLNIRHEGDWILLLAWMVACLLPNIAHPVLVIHGEKGSAKTTLARMMTLLIDPSATPLRSEPRDIPEWVQQADHGWLIALDNLSRVSIWFSDALCRAVSGESFSKRKLYTDSDDILISFRRCICVTGIEVVTQRPDLLDRSILLELEPFTSDRRRSEAMVLEEFDRALPEMLGGLFDILCRVLRELPNVQPERLPRMADFARVGVAVERALGWEAGAFTEAYERNIGSQNEESLASSCIGELLLSFMDAQPQDLEGGQSWQGTASTLLRELFERAKANNALPADFPRRPNALSGQLKQIAANLRAMGIEVSFSRTHGTRAITLTRRDKTV